MSDLDMLKTAVNESSELSKNGQHQEALRLLNEAIADAKHENRIRSVRILSQHAAVIAEATGDLNLVRHYCEEMISTSPGNAMALYALADILYRQGSADLARQQAMRSYSLVEHTETAEAKSLRELIAKTWPEIPGTRR